MFEITVRSAAFWLCWALAYSAGAGYAQEQDTPMVQIRQRKEKLRKEAIAFYATILNGKLERLEDCQISRRWLSREIDEVDAQSYFDVTAHASLVAPDHGTVPAEILDPKGRYSKLFCNEGETNADNKRRFLAFEKAFASDKSLRLEITQWSYTFPVFNEDFTRAEIWVQQEWRAWWNPREFGNWEGGNRAEIYKKRNGVWELLTETSSNHWLGSVRPLSAADADRR